MEISSEAYRAYSSSSEQPAFAPDYSEAFDNLVSDGTITTDQQEAIESAITSSSVDVSDGSNPLKSTLDSLVSDGTITSDQEAAIASALTPAAASTSDEPVAAADSLPEDIGSADSSTEIKGKMPPPPPPSGSGIPEEEDDDDDDYLEELLQDLVDNGSLSDDQLDTVESALSTGDTDVSDGSSPLKSVLDSLISDGTITSSQASTISEVLVPQNEE